MPASGVIKLLDANLWLALAFSDHLHHTKAKAWFDGQSEAASAFCRVTQMALLRHLTNSKIMGAFVQSQQAAWTHYDKLAHDPRVVFLDEPPGWRPHSELSLRLLHHRTHCGPMRTSLPLLFRRKLNS